MTRLARALCALHGAAALFLAWVAVQQAIHGAAWAVPPLVVCSLAPVAAAVREAEHADQRDAARADAERAARLRSGTALGWADLESACCLRAWESHGTDHDPHHCTRKDQAA